MSAEYSVEDFNSAAGNVEALMVLGAGEKRSLAKMLRFASDRIKAGESAVPVAWSLVFNENTGVNAMTTFSTEKEANDYADICAKPDVCSHNPTRPRVVPLFTHPPAQALKIDAPKVTAFLDGLALDASDADTLAYIRNRFSVPTKPVECINGCPERQVCDYCQPHDGKDLDPASRESKS